MYRRRTGEIFIRKLKEIQRSVWINGVHDRASRTVNNILQACGLEWEKTTVEDMDKRDHIVFVCLKCTFDAKCDGERISVRVCSWRDAVGVLDKF